MLTCVCRFIQTNQCVCRFIQTNQGREEHFQHFNLNQWMKE
jgi:hypothetical protein